ncbi:putative Beta-glucosidase [Candidatus Hydrogenisulfobacillus filiaventi]|uniref:Putative Beta-glucosidase n=1 Tax=Candidatus Hydrogenisulfobacillus filiaventi TaxID=2707344 RepID=A0A6F8ZDZ7_9FIRM|nr:putative Beta-glucosidase [Candidatus Hydrogenisulfobacillus filiaventi]
MPAPTWPADLPPFLWGAATSAHQVEGGTDNDWTDWEAAGRVRGQARSGAACDHWHRYREDLDLLQAIGLNAYRFSVEWSRVEPEPGRVDPAALDHYREVARAARTRGLIPCVTLHHFTLPRWFARRGGFAAAGAGRPFLAQVARTVRALAPWVPCFVVFNEPLIYVLMGYVRGEWPPGLRQPHRLLTLSRRLARLQREAYAVIKAEAPGALVGVAKHQVHFLPATPRWRDRAAAALAGRLFNDAFLEAVADRLDFIGLNYYTRNWVTARHPHPRFPSPRRTGGTGHGHGLGGGS